MIVTKDVSVGDLIIGDKNAVMVASRILAYGPEYTVQVTNPNTGNEFEHTFDLTECGFNDISDNINGNEFEVELPHSKVKIKFKLLTGYDEKNIDKELEAYKKIGSRVSPELTTRLKHTIISVNDAHSSSLTWIGGALGKKIISLGVDEFGQSGNLKDLYKHYSLDAEAIVDACAQVLITAN